MLASNIDRTESIGYWWGKGVWYVLTTKSGLLG